MDHSSYEKVGHARRATKGAWLCFALVVCLPVLAMAQSAVTHDLRSAILIRALGYERTVTSGSGELVLAVVGPTSGAAGRDASAMQRAFERAATRGLGGRDVRVVRVEQPVASARAAVRSAGAHVVYVPQGDEFADGAASLTEDHRLVMCGDPRSVGRGCVLSVEAVDSGSRIVVDVGRASAGGHRFDARLLGLSRVVR